MIVHPSEKSDYLCSTSARNRADSRRDSGLPPDFNEQAKFLITMHPVAHLTNFHLIEWCVISNKEHILSQSFFNNQHSHAAQTQSATILPVFSCRIMNRILPFSWINSKAWQVMATSGYHTSNPVSIETRQVRIQLGQRTLWRSSFDSPSPRSFHSPSLKRYLQSKPTARIGRALLRNGQNIEAQNPKQLRSKHHFMDGFSLNLWV